MVSYQCLDCFLVPWWSNVLSVRGREIIVIFGVVNVQHETIEIVSVLYL